MTQTAASTDFPVARALNRDDYRTLVLSALGGALEFYDFVIFVFFVTVLGQLFFPPDIPDWLQQLQAFGIFAAGYLARPLGGIVLAHYGDMLGRKKMFTLSILMMALSTLGIALLPTYRSIGIAAPILLLSLRILQGAAIGGEVPGAWTFVAEHVPASRTGLACGILTSGLTAGILLGSLVAVLINKSFTAIEILEFGWRLPFFLGGGFGLVAVYLRRWLAETPIFQELKAKKALAAELPLLVVLKGHLAGVLVSVALTWLLSAAIVVVILMTPTLLQTLYTIDATTAFIANSFATLCLSVGCVLAGRLVDRIGGGRFFVLGGLVLGAASYLFYTWLPVHPEMLFWLYGLVGLCVGVVGGVPYVMINSFPPAIRFTGISFSYNLAYAIFGGLTPLLVTLGLRVDPLAHAHYVLLTCAIAVLVGITLLVGPRRSAEVALAARAR
ncbi:Predicted arabinose efflux permease, MFS family [Arboricoccus pini]|uniref:Predicted arabinose efflux permease, MFS family n=1 Tax=Arboricoccus pini TaxID=1963835 RepID=A0A212PWU5_9PROT|nr:MFS transporter [Arboricoccus pini]SNB51504.1 Predicted arabinose efflux permease, MFS family [Arboricoccus pini]